MTLGQIGEIKQNSAPVMHVRRLYVGEGLLEVRWRGAALTQFDGKRWFNMNEAGEEIRVPADHSVALKPERRVRPRSSGWHIACN